MKNLILLSDSYYKFINLKNLLWLVITIVMLVFVWSCNQTKIIKEWEFNYDLANKYEEYKKLIESNSANLVKDTDDFVRYVKSDEYLTEKLDVKTLNEFSEKIRFNENGLMSFSYGMIANDRNKAEVDKIMDKIVKGFGWKSMRVLIEGHYDNMSCSLPATCSPEVNSICISENCTSSNSDLGFYTDLELVADDGESFKIGAYSNMVLSLLVNEKHFGFALNKPTKDVVNIDVLEALKIDEETNSVAKININVINKISIRKDSLQSININGVNYSIKVLNIEEHKFSNNTDSAIANSTSCCLSCNGTRVCACVVWLCGKTCCANNSCCKSSGGLFFQLPTYNYF